MLHIMFEAGLMDVTVKLVLCVVICLQYSDASTDIQSKTYQHTLENGEKVICNKCSPGHYLIDYCFTNGGNSQCAPCDNGTYNSEYTRATSCARCDTECIQPKDREYIATNCTKVSNISCKCMEGYYREPYKFGLCLWIVPCPPGEGVVHEGHEWANTVCGVCPENHFSANSSKTERCQQCSPCPPETVQYQDCQPEADRVCGPPGADDLPIGALIGIGVGAPFLVLVVITLVCCFCVMRERCAAIRKSVCRCCYRPYQECTQHDKSMKYTPAHTDDAGGTMSNGQVTPDLIQNTPNGRGDPRKIHEIPNGVAVGNGTAGSHTARNTQSGGTVSCYDIFFTQ
ncbi:tumor necrosis factor receptor superfamily member 5-like [Mercenaria mercenaria]|uniref:tumor necrosis factor receptor superfamily member 5-like n=1 Tax=Mercenaria mercenaria TaxID=6596 RepID=UPI00234E4581|nr:tumor necrosis factor receptor superfamily member 5-like [Mercenaria mercenaria]